MFLINSLSLYLVFFHPINERFLPGRLSDSKKLRGGVLFAERIPKTENGKVSRKEVISLFDGVPMDEIN